MRPVGEEACPPASAYPHRALLLPVCRIPYLDSVLHARTRVHQSPAHARCLIVCISLSRRPSAAPTALQEILPQALKAVPQSSLQQSPRAVPAVPAARHQPPVLSVPCGAGLWPAGCRQGWPAADAGRAGSPRAGVGGKGRLIFLYSVGGRGPEAPRAGGTA